MFHRAAKALVVLALLAATAAAAPWIGIALEKGPTGVRVKSVLADTPGERAGIHEGDEVLSIDGAAVHTSRELIDLVAQKGVGTKIAVAIQRGDKKLDIQLALEARPDQIALLEKQLMNKPAPDFALDALGGSGKLA